MTVSERLFGDLHQQFHAIESVFLRSIILLALICVCASAAYLLVRTLIFPLHLRAKRLNGNYAILKIFLVSPLLKRAILIVPLITAGIMVRGLFCSNALTTLLNQAIHIAFLFYCAYTFSALMRTFYAIIKHRQGAEEAPQKGIFQILALAGYLFATVAIIATLLGRDPMYVLSGLTAISAVLMLVFKDAILGFAAGIILSGNRMIQINDWIVVPGTDADGFVREISLTTVRVQNFDKTITTIPAYDLVSKPFTNWRGMVESGGRRIKRSIKIDLDSIHFATEEQLKRWQKIDLLRDYLRQKDAEITASKANCPTAEDSIANARHLTNIGTFRAYCMAYLRKHAHIHQDHILLVRQLPPEEHGIPLEIYCFTNTTKWTEYENIQSDIFDHLLAILSEFGLSAFQLNSTGAMRDAAGSTLFGRTDRV